jgi:hypothetical protein
MLPLGVGPAPRQPGQHPRHRRRIGRAAVKPEFTCYAAHVSTLVICEGREETRRKTFKSIFASLRVLRG